MSKWKRKEVNLNETIEIQCKSSHRIKDENKLEVLEFGTVRDQTDMGWNDRERLIKSE